MRAESLERRRISRELHDLLRLRLISSNVYDWFCLPMGNLSFMLQMRRNWRTFQQGEPGSRFTERYERRQSEGRPAWQRPLYIAVGVVITLLSLALGWAPGPGMLTLFLGLWLIAGEFYSAARLMDWGEVRSRGIWAAFLSFWNAANRQRRIMTVLGLCAAFVLLLLGIVRLFTG